MPTDDPEAFFGETRFTNYTATDPLTLLQSGEADAAVIKACDLERALASRQSNRTNLRVLDPKSHGADDAGALRCLHSTELFPELVFASLPHDAPETIEKIAVALLTMPETKAGWRWGLASSFGSVDTLYRSLRIGPYEYLRHTDWRMFVEQNKSYLYLALLVLIGIHIVRTNRLVFLRTAQLRRTIVEKDRAQEEADHMREQLARHDRLTIISSMSNMIVHELAQPITSLTNFTASLTQYLRRAGTKDAHANEAVLEMCR